MAIRTAVLLVAALAIVTVTVSGCGESTPPPPAGPQPAPPGWDATRAKGDELRLGLETRKDAVALFERVVAETPGFAGGHFELGAAYHDAASTDLGAPIDARNAVHEKAIASLRRAQALGYEPSAEVREKITQVQIHLRKFAEAEQEARLWVAEQPGSPTAWMTLAGSIARARPEEAARLLLEAGPKIGEQGQPEHGGNLVLAAGLGTMPTEARRRLIAAAQAIVDAELAARRSSAELDLLRARILTTTADHLEPDPARQRALHAEADKILASAGR